MQRAILAVRYGPLDGKKAILEPGERLRVGRKARADLAIPDDQMSGVHFELTWDGARCRMRDLRSSAGTLLGGERVEAGEVQNGAWIRAGGTDFMVHLEAATPPPTDDDAYLDDAEPDEVEPLAALWLSQNRASRQAAREARAARSEAALQALQKVEGNLYAVLDAARSERILVLLRESVETYRSLYEGIDGESMEHVAPHLVELPRGSKLLGRLVREGWEQRWGIFVETSRSVRSFKELRRHLRRFLMIADADTRKKFYFRFYDPGVLREFLPITTPKQRSELFGQQVGAFLMEDAHGGLARFDAEVG
ncbi:DUF4123 domain-containing protein [Chondromyces crocatus]|uniref:FHA domain-containing protein n=1 Tax=Chondromyces crocatus TaxID=52 RepID=A0A0K1ERC8_CHOCO|nr:DUF4123 domain-containing protein [Chondromyces crocatus]AKT43485.1 uncharacterized protein CMC5_077170 [Chondromyces crocatus]